MQGEEVDDRLDPIKDFKERLVLRRQAITKGLLVPNFVEEYTKSTVVVMLFIVMAFFNYKALDNLILRYNTDTEDPLVTQIRNNLAEEDKIRAQEASNQPKSSALPNSTYGSPSDPQLRILVERLLNQTTDDQQSNTQSGADSTDTNTSSNGNTQNTGSTQNGDGTSDTSTSITQDQHEVIREGEFQMEMRDWVNIVTGGLLLICLVCICFGNAPQFNFTFLMFLGLLCSTVIMGGQGYLVFLGTYELKEVIASVMFFFTNIIATFTSDDFNPSSLIFSNFNADRAFIYSEYAYQRLFGRVSIFWGMRFGKYQRFKEHFQVKAEFEDPSDDPPPETGAKGDKYLSNKLESMRDVDAVSQITRPASPMQSNRSIWRKDQSFNLHDQRGPEYRVNVKKIYAFYKKNGIKHSFLLRKKEQIKLTLSKYMEKKLIHRFLLLFKPFRIYKKRLLQKYPFYYPTRILIAVLIQIFIQTEVFINLISLIQKSFAYDISWVNRATGMIKSTTEDLYRSATISLCIVAAFFLFIVLFSTIKTFMAFKMTTLDFRLNGYDHYVDHHSVWFTVKFMQTYLGNAIFSTGPFLFVYFIFFWCLFSLSFWQWVWSQRRFWLTIVSVFFISFILDLIVSYLLSNGRYFKSRKCIQFLDLLKIFLGFYSGLFTGFMRFLLSFLFLNISLFRVDKTGIPNWLYQIINIDIINKPYICMVKLYHVTNNPIKMNFVNLLIDHCMKMRLKDGPAPKAEDSETVKFDVEQRGRMSPEKKKRFLRAAYRWQLFALMARNPLILEFRKENRHAEHH